MDTGLVLFFGLVVAYTLVALWLGRFSITMPMVFARPGVDPVQPDSAGHRKAD